jgi:hypothetical protein
MHIIVLGENVIDTLKQMLDDWNLQESKMVALTSDSGSNMIKAAELGQWPRISCFGHNLHNAVNSGLNSDERIGKALKVCRNVCSISE